MNYIYYTMNSANQNLQAVKNRKALITKKYHEAKKRLEEKYAEDMTILDKEEKEWLEQFDEVPIEDIYRNETRRYRKKPLIVEAYVATEEEYIETLEGTMKANIGDYVITGVKGEKYPCKPDVFHETYEVVK